MTQINGKGFQNLNQLSNQIIFLLWNFMRYRAVYKNFVQVTRVNYKKYWSKDFSYTKANL